MLTTTTKKLMLSKLLWNLIADTIHMLQERQGFNMHPSLISFSWLQAQASIKQVLQEMRANYNKQIKDFVSMHLCLLILVVCSSVHNEHHRYTYKSHESQLSHPESMCSMWSLKKDECVRILKFRFWSSLFAVTQKLQQEPMVQTLPHQTGESSF